MTEQINKQIENKFIRISIIFSMLHDQDLAPMEQYEDYVHLWRDWTSQGGQMESEIYSDLRNLSDSINRRKKHD